MYRLLKFPARLAFRLWCRDLRVNDPSVFEQDGPLLIAANHPDSFLDAILICTLFNKPVHALARGDAFVHPLVNKILRALNMLPVYRLSEGAENLGKNYDSFRACREIFNRNGVVLIFSEGRCINEWKLRPLKKGTARLALDAWENNIPLRVLPAGINYSSFRKFGKNIQLNFGKPITGDSLPALQQNSEGQNIADFNHVLRDQLQKLTVKIDPPNSVETEKIFSVRVPLWQKIVLFFPALIGFVFHAPLYLPIKIFSKKTFGAADHYDSVVVGLLFICYPVWLLLLLISGLVFFGLYALWLLALPFCAYAYVRLKRQF